MNPSTSPKTRFDMRLPADLKRLFESAATLAGYSSLTDFMIQAARDRAREILDEHDRLALSVRDREVVYAALREESGPNDTLRRYAGPDSRE